MKKFLLCMMLAGLMMPVVAQEKLTVKKHVNEMKPERGFSTQSTLPMIPERLVEVGELVFMGMSENGYDRQSQGSVYPAARLHDDGAFIGATWTTDDAPPFNGSNTPNRGVAYTYSTDGGASWEPVDLRAGEIPLYWPSYAQWGTNGEAILARSYDSYMYEGIQILDGLVLMTRENRGEGKWTLTPLPYPAGITPDFDHYLAWARMTTSGENHQYIHIMTPIGTPGGELYEGYEDPIFYYRTQDGATWDVEGKLVSTMIGATDWEVEASYFDAFHFAVQGDVVACVFMRLGYHAFVAKSLNNGDTWTSTKFFNSSCRWFSTPAEYADSCYIPCQGTIALDNDGKMHVAFGVRAAKNTEEEGYLSLYRGYSTSFISYWNEDMDPLDGGIDFPLDAIDDFMHERFIDYDLSDYDFNEGGRLYITSTTPDMPIIGFLTPCDGDYFTAPGIDTFDWIQDSYGRAGTFSFAQMEVDKDNRMHLAYLGIANNGGQDDHWLRHPYYTVRNTDGTWMQTECLVKSIDYIDREFSYPVCAGVTEDYKMLLMAQTDPFPGVGEAYAGTPADHTKTPNRFVSFYVKNVDINEVGYTPLTMNVIPNPASGQATVTFEGKGNVTVYNMLGQAVYHAENVENTKTISLNNMTTGVYFVTVRSGNATATQKLIVQ